MKALKYIGLGIAGLLVLMIVIGALVGPSNKSATGQSATVSQPQTQQAPAQPAQPAKWHQVATLSGNGYKKGPIFALTGAEARIRYQVAGGAMSALYVSVVEEGSQSMFAGGPEVQVDGAESGESYLYRGAGRYYLDITAANCTWTVTVEEKR